MKMRSFIKYLKNADFPIQNLPYGVFSKKNESTRRIGVAIGDQILDLSKISHLFEGPHLKNNQHVFKQPTLNSFMGLTKSAWLEARRTLQSLLSVENTLLQDDSELRSKAFVSQSEATMHLPAQIGDYTGFFTTYYHALNAGTIVRGKEDPFFPQWKYLPSGYHGRCSSIVLSGTPVRRPNGQQAPLPGEKVPRFGPSNALDFEIEIAAFYGGAESKLGEPIPIDKTSEHIFGMVLMNDWSVRDFQGWEGVPLGPLTSKNLATTISPWVVPIFALEPFLVNNFPQDPEPLPYLKQKEKFNFDIKVQVDLQPANTQTSSIVTRSNYRYIYWTALQQLAHHTISGCNFKAGDLMGGGTLSGEKPETMGGCMWELSWGGQKPITLQDKSKRSYLLDGDTVIMSAKCEGDDYTIGFGPCSGKVLPALKI